MNNKTLFQPDFYTMGYEGFTVFEMIEILKKYNIKTVVDIRIKPFSMNAQFSKKNLEISMKNSEIEYICMRELGNPKQFWGKADWKYLYRNHIKPVIPSVVEKLRRMKAPICLMCKEKHPEDCHRSIIAHELSFSGFIGKNLRKIY